MTRTKTTQEVLDEIVADENAAKLAAYRKAQAEGRSFHYPTVRTVADEIAERAGHKTPNFAARLAAEVAARDGGAGTKDFRLLNGED